MVIVLPANQKESFGARIGAGLGQGLSAGAMQKAQFAQEMAQERYKREQKMQLVEDIHKRGRGAQQSFRDQIDPNQIKGAIDHVEEMLGFKLTPEQKAQAARLMAGGAADAQQDPFAEAEMFAAVGEHDLSKVASDRAKAQIDQETQLRKERREERDFAYKRAGKIFEAADEMRSNLPIREASLAAMDDALNEGDQSYFSLDNLAEKTGIEAFRSAKGGQFKAAGKNFLVANVSKFGARPNMYIEQQIADMLPKVGRSREANLTAKEMMNFEVDIDKKRLETIDMLEDLYLASGKPIPAGFGKEIDKFMKPYVENRQKDLMFRLKELAKEEKEGLPKGGFVRMSNPETGEVWEIPSKQADEAKKAGWNQL